MKSEIKVLILSFLVTGGEILHWLGGERNILYKGVKTSP